MKYFKFNIVLAVCLLNTGILFSQTNCIVPLPPALTSVSVNPDNGTAELRWAHSASTDIAAYIIYTYSNGDGMPIDTVWNPSLTSWSVPTNPGKSISYVVTAHRLSVVPGLPGCTSPLSNAVSTIFCSGILDTCNSRIVLSWNKYTDTPLKVTGYAIFISENGGPLVEKYTTDRNVSSYNFTDFRTGSSYSFVVRAKLEDGTNSGSNRFMITTSMQQPPAWINADYATVNPVKGVDLSFSIDPASAIKTFSIQRNTENSGFTELARVSPSGGKVLYTDEKADVSKLNQYRLSAINNCNNQVRNSDISSNIVLTVRKQDNYIFLDWNRSFDRRESSVTFHVFINKGKGFETAAITADTMHRMDLRDIMYDISSGEACFYIEAFEAGNKYGINSRSRSSQACFEPEEVITVPNVFTPGNDLINDTFRPVLSFTPAEYHLIISDRKGKTLFETYDYAEEWDGSSAGKEDVYLWFLKLKSPSGKLTTKSGTVTMIIK